MKVDPKQLSIYSGLVFFIIFAIFTIALEQSMADKVFSSYDSQIVHEKECKELDFSKRLIEFPSLQQAITEGALPCKFCMGQYASHSGDQQPLISDTIFNHQTMNSQDTQDTQDTKDTQDTQTDAVNHQEEPRHKKTQKTISDAIRIYKFFTVEQLIGLCGNIENKNADFEVRLPKGFKETLTKLEARYNDEWVAFDQHTDGCTVYYGWVRGNAIGEFKLRLCEDHQTDSISIDFISLTRHGVGGMAISRYKDTQNTDKKAFSSYDWFRLPLKVKDKLVGPISFETDKKAFLSYDRLRLPLKGRDKWGPFSVKVVGEVFGTGEMMVGSWDTDHGSFGNYKGTLYGIRLDSVKTASASITDQSLYQSMVHFESLKNKLKH